jgi:2-phosphosulfolactate phosphatase
MPQLQVHALPKSVAAKELTGSTVVVIDLLRATSTICQALASGARDVVPFLEVDEALAAAAKLHRSKFVLGGERKGKQINGFDLGNSPGDYTPDHVGGRRLLFTSTNGSKALDHARLAERVLVGSALNRAALVGAIQDAPRVDILCAGTEGKISRDDLLAAGAIAHSLGNSWQRNELAESVAGDWAQLLDAARSVSQSPSEQLAIELRETPGGRNLLAIELDDDLMFCAQLDRLDVVPELDTKAWRIYVP